MYIYIYIHIHKWRFPETGVLPNHPLIDYFSIVNHPFLGIPIYGNPICMRITIKMNIRVYIIYIYVYIYICVYIYMYIYMLYIYIYICVCVGMAGYKVIDTSWCFGSNHISKSPVRKSTAALFWWLRTAKKISAEKLNIYPPVNWHFYGKP